MTTSPGRQGARQPRRPRISLRSCGLRTSLMVAVRWPPSCPPPARGRTQTRWRAAVQIGERRVEAADAAEPGAEGDLGHRIVGSVEQPLGALDAARGRDLLRACADMAFEQAGEMARGDPEFLRQCVDRAALQRAAVDQFQRARNRGARAVPRRQNGAVSGRQRRHGRYPAASAAAAVG